MPRATQGLLFPDAQPSPCISAKSSSTFVPNMSLPVHRWFRYSAGFSAEWVEQVIAEARQRGPVEVFDPFAGSGTTLIAAENSGVRSYGIEAHPFVYRIALAKLQWRSDPQTYLAKTTEMRRVADSLKPETASYPELIQKCYNAATLSELDVLRRAGEMINDNSPASQLAWLTLVAILRKTSHAGTAQWQYVLPRKQKRLAQDAKSAFSEMARTIHHDMLSGSELCCPPASLEHSDARDCQAVPDNAANLVITSPPYPNNYDYADATRLEMTFMREINGWGDLQESVRRHLVRSCSQHVPERAVRLDEVLESAEVAPIRGALADVCSRLAEVRKTKGGKKTYHLMVACYFRDLARVWMALRRVCRPDSRICFVIGDSAPYGVYVPVVPWLGALAQAAGFGDFSFERTRDRNVKWKNRKHRVPLQEGRLWVEG